MPAGQPDVNTKHHMFIAHLPVLLKILHAFGCAARTSNDKKFGARMLLQWLRF
jgi:hypothetical protein